MVKLRLSRAGRKKAPIYKIVVADSRSRRDGKFIELLGQYNPNFSPARVTLKEERTLYWLKSGAQPTVTVRNILSHRGLLLKHNLMKKGFDAAKIEAEFNKWSQLQQAKISKQSNRKLKLKEKKKKASETESAGTEAGSAS